MDNAKQWATKYSSQTTAWVSEPTVEEGKRQVDKPSFTSAYASLLSEKRTLPGSSTVITPWRRVLAQLEQNYARHLSRLLESRDASIRTLQEKQAKEMAVVSLDLFIVFLPPVNTFLFVTCQDWCFHQRTEPNF